MSSDERVPENTEMPVSEDAGAKVEAGVVEAAASAEAVVPVIETPVAAAEPAPPAATAASKPKVEDVSMDALEQYRPMQAGDVVVGVVMRVDRDSILVDVGAKTEGVIRASELTREPNLLPENIVKVGDEIRVMVVDPEGHDGNPVLSKKRADFEQAWFQLMDSRDRKETVQGKVLERVKGGLRVDVGLPGFVPASHVGASGQRVNLDQFVGQTVPLKVLEVDRDHRKVIMSHRLAMEDDRLARSKETREGLTEGQVRKGVVRRLTTYGAFVDLGGIDGLLHISEMSWTRLSDPREVLHEGQELDVMVLKLDLKQNRVSLGLRQILPDPWKDVAALYSEAQVVTGTVTRVVPFGAFVQLEGGIEGIIPNAELLRTPNGRSSVPVVQGEEVTAKILTLRPEERKISLSLRALVPQEEAVVSAAPVTTNPAPPRETSRRDRNRSRDEDRDDYGRYAPTRQDEPRFTIGEAFAAAQKQKSRRERRAMLEEEEEFLDDELVLEDEAPEEEVEETGQG